jgi:hypothetical protein
MMEEPDGLNRAQIGRRERSGIDTDYDYEHEHEMQARRLRYARNDRLESLSHEKDQGVLAGALTRTATCLRAEPPGPVAVRV